MKGLFCINVGDYENENNRLLRDMSSKCWSESKDLLGILATFPFIILFGLIIPLSLTLIFWFTNKKGNIREKNFLKVYEKY